MRKLLLLISMLLPVMAIAQMDSLGIYIKVGGATQKVKPLKYYKVKTNTLASAFTYGIAGSSIKTIYKNPHSQNTVSPGACFLFYFGDVLQYPSYYMFSKAYTPNDFIVAQLKAKKKIRELSVGKVNIYSGAQMGADESADVKLNFRELKPGVYEVFFTEIPQPGEYCFVFSEMGGSGGFLPIFDFGINGAVPSWDNTKNSNTSEDTPRWMR